MMRKTQQHLDSLFDSVRITQPEPGAIDTAFSNHDSGTSSLCIPKEPTIFPRVVMINRAFFFYGQRAIHELPTILWYICLRLVHLFQGIHKVLCYNCY
jgi:hypothetical protein